MSRVGSAPVSIPSGVEVKVDGSVVTIKGSKGELQRIFSEKVAVAVDDDQVVVTRVDDVRESRALHGLTRALVNNMVVGVSDGFEKRLELVGVGYRASLKGKNLELLVGFSHPVEIPAAEGIELEVPENTKIIVRGIDKELVGQIAADIRAVRPPEPYKGKGIRYEGEYVRRKAGKAAATVGS
jgi:large subunit ribosomal protein L6